MTPRLSVLMPTYNRIQWLGNAMDSVLAPGLDLELVVLDNGSEDGTWAYLSERARQDGRVRAIHWDVNNAGAAYPALLETARGEYVNFFADDDEMLPGGLARKMEVLDRQPEVGLVFSTVRCMNAGGVDQGEGAWTVIAAQDDPGRRDLFDSLILGNFVPMPSAMFRRALAPTGEILRNPRWIPSSDWQLWLDLARRTALTYLREPTIRLRLHGEQTTVTHGVQLGMFIDVNMAIWRYWMLEAEPPFIPSASAWTAMVRAQAGALQATHGQDRAKVQEGLRRLHALRDEQEVGLTAAREMLEAPFPELFLREAGQGWEAVVAAYLRAFAPEDPVALALLAGGQEAAGLREAVGRVVGPGKAPLVRVLEPDQVLGTLREYPHCQWVPDQPGALEGVKGRRLCAAFASLKGAS